jgi:hypothetical protein
VWFSEPTRPPLLVALRTARRKAVQATGHRGRDPPTGPTVVRDHRVLHSERVYMDLEQRVVMLGLLIIALSSAAILIVTLIR